MTTSRIPGVAKRTAITLAGCLALAGPSALAASGADGSGGISPTGPEPSAENSDGHFPVHGAVVYGDGLGAGRNHQGQDLMARCGKPIVAAQSGRVQFRDYQASGAGNYVVIDGKGRQADTVYMHMERPASVREGQRVAAGQQIGVVGTTGRSSACHLHFEMWSKPGWYEGGEPINPTPYLKRWQKQD